LAWAKTQGAKSPGQFANYPGLKNGTSCFETAMEMTPYLFCLAHQVYFSVTGDKVTGGPNPSTDNAIWVAQAEIPLAEVLGAELKAAPAPPRPTTTTVPGPVTTHPPTTTPTTVAPTTTTTGPNAPTTVDVTTTTVPYKVWSKQIGSGVTIVPPGPASAGDGSPADAAMGFIPAFVGPDPTDACQYFAPAAADACKTFTSHIRPLNLDVKALAPGYTAIKDDRALVVVTETICASSGCQSASQASVGFSTGQSFDKLWDEVVPAFAATDFSLPALPCVQVDGHWYIDPPAAFPQTSTTPTS
jgi:hypothetical protein